MELQDTRDILNSFAKYVIQQSRSNLTKGKKNVSKALYNSLDYNFLSIVKRIKKKNMLLNFQALH